MRLRRDTKEDRQKEAKSRQADYNKLTVEQKIAKLDSQLGKGVGATKQRAKLLQLSLAKPAKQAKPAKTPKEDKGDKGKDKSFKSKYQQKQQK